VDVAGRAVGARIPSRRGPAPAGGAIAGLELEPLLELRGHLGSLLLLVRCIRRFLTHPLLLALRWTRLCHTRIMGHRAEESDKACGVGRATKQHCQTIFLQSADAGPYLLPLRLSLVAQLLLGEQRIDRRARRRPAIEEGDLQVLFPMRVADESDLSAGWRAAHRDGHSTTAARVYIWPLVVRSSAEKQSATQRRARACGPTEPKSET
jgi:hypothetical protein